MLYEMAMRPLVCPASDTTSLIDTKFIRGYKTADTSNRHSTAADTISDVTLYSNPCRNSFDPSPNLRDVTVWERVECLLNALHKH